MSKNTPVQGAVISDSDPPSSNSPAVVEVLDIDFDEDDICHGPESWREVADTLADPIDPG